MMYVFFALCTDPSFIVEHIFPKLLSMASKWLAVGEALSLDEDLLDEIFTNNDTEEACLRVMLEHYMERSDLKHSWEEIREARRKVEEKDGETGELEPTSQRSQEGTSIITGETIFLIVVICLPYILWTMSRGTAVRKLNQRIVTVIQIYLHKYYILIVTVENDTVKLISRVHC